MIETSSKDAGVHPEVVKRELVLEIGEADGSDEMIVVEWRGVASVGGVR